MFYLACAGSNRTFMELKFDRDLAIMTSTI